MKTTENKTNMIIAVLLSQHVSVPYDYLVPLGLDLRVGDVVSVPLQNREVIGVVWECPRLWKKTDIALSKIKPIAYRYEVAPLSESLCQFVDWMAQYVMTPSGIVLRHILNVPKALEPLKRRKAFILADKPPSRMTEARQRVCDVLSDKNLWKRGDILEKAQVSQSVLDGLVKQNCVRMVECSTEDIFPVPNPDFLTLDFSREQGEAIRVLREFVKIGKFQPCLLDGVTGSGKTEVYFEAVAETIRQGRQSVILLPEISLTSQLLDRFKKRFGCEIAIWHSNLSPAQRVHIWRLVSEGKIKTLVGARSALFLPWKDIGVIVVDEEHDGGYKQEEGMIYNARDMAVIYSRFSDAVVILASATPSLETILNAQKERYALLSLPNRHGVAQLPEISLIDLRQIPPAKGCWLTPVLISEIENTLSHQKQVLLFLNRRGYAPLTICKSCGYRYACQACESWLVEHRYKRQLICHQCGITCSMPSVCDSCGAEESLTACGPGVERIYEEISSYFPEAKICILSSDLIVDMEEMHDMLERIKNGDIDIVIGTQVLAKGHHFPHLALTAVVDADLGLNNSDLRAGERTYQMLSQVAGRAGREAIKGKALLQSYMPEHPVLQALQSGKRDSFIERELQMREQVNMPPFGKLAGLILSCEDLLLLNRFSQHLSSCVPPHENIRVLGPAPAPIAKLRHRYRVRFLVKSKQGVLLQDFIRLWLRNVKLPKKIRLIIDIDPYHFL